MTRLRALLRLRPYRRAAEKVWAESWSAELREMNVSDYQYSRFQERPVDAPTPHEIADEKGRCYYRSCPASIHDRETRDADGTLTHIDGKAVR